MFLLNTHALHELPLDAVDAEVLGAAGAQESTRFLEYRDDHAPTPLHSLPAMSQELGIGAIYMKDEGYRLGLGSFKALGGSYAVIRLLLSEASRTLGRRVDIDELHTPAVRSIAARMTVACATDGNHGRSVAQGARLVGARALIFVHSGVSEERVSAIARLGAEIVRVDGHYDDSVEEASQVCTENAWCNVSDTSWPGYEHIPGLVMQGYTAMVQEALEAMPGPPTHVFIQAGVGGLAAAVAGHLAATLGGARPVFVVVEPDRAACFYESALAGRRLKLASREPTVMAMLECYEPSLIAWRILLRTADAFMTVGEDAAVAVMNRLARPMSGDPVIVAGESGGVGLAGLMKAAADQATRAALGLDAGSRVLLINTEGATDPFRYRELVGFEPTRFGSTSPSSSV